MRQVSGYAGFHLNDVIETQWSTASDDDVNAEVCGTRPLVPQLQLEIEVFRNLGVLKSSYARCRVPSSNHFISYTRLDGTRFYAKLKNILDRRPVMSDNLRTKGAKVIVAWWVFATLLTIGSYVLGPFREGNRAVVEEKAKVAWAQRTVGHFSMSWLDPIVNLYRSKEADDITEQDMNTLEPDFEFEPYSSFRRLWQEEIASKGLDDASLTATIRRFIGVDVIVKMLFTVGASALLELAGMTVVLDLLLNYLRWASDTHMRWVFCMFACVSVFVPVCVCVQCLC